MEFKLRKSEIVLKNNLKIHKIQKLQSSEIARDIRFEFLIFEDQKLFNIYKSYGKLYYNKHIVCCF